MDLVKFRYMKEEASNIPANTVHGLSPLEAWLMNPGIVYEENFYESRSILIKDKQRR
jgi:hypothetical protein